MNFSRCITIGADLRTFAKKGSLADTCPVFTLKRKICLWLVIMHSYVSTSTSITFTHQMTAVCEL